MAKRTRTSRTTDPSQPESAGAAMVAAIVAEMGSDGLVPDARELAILDAAATIRDRMALLDEIVTREGCLWTSPNGVTKAHPAVVEHRAQATALARVLGSVSMGETAGKNAVKQRAARARWDRVARNG